MISHPNMTKREFFRLCGAGLCLASAGHISGIVQNLQAQQMQKGLVKAKRTPYFTSLGKEAVRCELCPRHCRVDKGKRGACKVRENRGGKLYSLAYGNPCAVHLDPIEKKPLFHVLPGTTSFSIATVGCNFHCKFCQNWEISQVPPEEVHNYDLQPEGVVKKAKEMRARSVAYTYVEPTVFCEYVMDSALLVKSEGLLNVCHSNGFINQAPLQDLCKVLDAANIDLKSFTESFYQELCGGQLHPVLETLKTLKREKVHLEITNLIIPTKNDDLAMIREMCLWVKRELGAETPIHFSRFYPLYKLQNLPPTPVTTIEKARAVALSTGLEYVYIGNVPGHEGENTFCPHCRKAVIRRKGFMVEAVHMKKGKCGYCGKSIPGIWA